MFNFCNLYDKYTITRTYNWTFFIFTILTTNKLNEEIITNHSMQCPCFTLGQFLKLPFGSNQGVVLGQNGGKWLGQLYLDQLFPKYWRINEVRKLGHHYYISWPEIATSTMLDCENIGGDNELETCAKSELWYHVENQSILSLDF